LSLIARDRCAQPLRQAEIEEFGAVFRKHDIARLQVAMYYAGAMCAIERIGDFDSVP
jgi:hypothetical protein